MQARASLPSVVALVAAMGTGGVAGAGLGRKRKREAADIVEVSLESRYLADLGDRRFELVPGLGLSHYFSAQVRVRIFVCLRVNESCVIRTSFCLFSRRILTGSRFDFNFRCTRVCSCAYVLHAKSPLVLAFFSGRAHGVRFLVVVRRSPFALRDLEGIWFSLRKIYTMKRCTEAQ